MTLDQMNTWTCNSCGVKNDRWNPPPGWAHINTQVFGDREGLITDSSCHVCEKCLLVHNKFLGIFQEPPNAPETEEEEATIG